MNTLSNVLFCQKNHRKFAKYRIKPYFCTRNNKAGCSSARLEYASGGRVVGSSNLLTPTIAEQIKKRLTCKSKPLFYFFICLPPPAGGERIWNEWWFWEAVVRLSRFSGYVQDGWIENGVWMSRNHAGRFFDLLWSPGQLAFAFHRLSVWHPFCLILFSWTGCR